MDEERFLEAVEIARDSIRQTEEAFGASTAEQIAGFLRDAPTETRERYLRVLIWVSEEIMAAWDAVSLVRQDLLLEGEAIPPELAEWEVDRRAGKRQRPTRPGPDPDANLARDRAIVDAVQWATQNGFTATRNRIRGKEKLSTQACFQGGSACDVVGVAANMGYKNVERIWNNSKDPDSPIRRRPLVVTEITSLSPPRVRVSYEEPKN